MSRAKARGREMARVIGQADVSLLDLVDNVINRGVVVTGDVMLGVADVDLIYLRLSVLLCAADRILSPEPEGGE